MAVASLTYADVQPYVILPQATHQAVCITHVINVPQQPVGVPGIQLNPVLLPFGLLDRLKVDIVPIASTPALLPSLPAEHHKQTISGGAGGELHVSNDKDSKENREKQQKVSGGKAGEVISEGKAEEVISGGKPEEVISGGKPEEVISGGKADEAVSGGKADEAISGGKADEAISGGKAEEVISGGKAEEVISGEKAEEVTSGEKAEEVISGGKHAKEKETGVAEVLQFCIHVRKDSGLRKSPWCSSGTTIDMSAPEIVAPLDANHVDFVTFDKATRHKLQHRMVSGLGIASMSVEFKEPLAHPCRVIVTYHTVNAVPIDSVADLPNALLDHKPVAFLLAPVTAHQRGMLMARAAQTFLESPSH